MTTPIFGFKGSVYDEIPVIRFTQIATCASWVTQFVLEQKGIVCDRLTPFNYGFYVKLPNSTDKLTVVVPLDRIHTVVLNREFSELGFVRDDKLSACDHPIFGKTFDNDGIGYCQSWQELIDLIQQW